MLIIDQIHREGGYKMENKKMDYVATIRYRSREKITKKPEIFTTGGYSALHETGEEIFFDWNDMRAVCEETSDGYIEIEATLTSFDPDVFGDGESLDYISAEDLTNSDLTEVYFECYKEVDEIDFIFLDVIEFEVYDRSTEKTFNFSEYTLDVINKFNYKEYKA